MQSASTLVARTGIVLAGFVLLAGCGGDDGMGDPIDLVIPGDADPGAAQRPQVTLTISNGAAVTGSMVITLLPEHAPVTVANFLSYVNSGFYTNTIIHRHDAGFVMQGGGYVTPVAATDTPAHKPTDAPIQLEVKVSNVLGTVAMARTNALHSATSEFFINLANNDFLDFSAGGYAAFGYITEFTLVNAMKLAPCVSSNITGGSTYGCLPVPNLVITSAQQTR
jgi:cyclophilin family peptidyl-prolyl cis-trans isomerase